VHQEYSGRFQTTFRTSRVFPDRLGLATYLEVTERTDDIIEVGHLEVEVEEIRLGTSA
jgi:hypothetical protein